MTSELHHTTLSDKLQIEKWVENTGEQGIQGKINNSLSYYSKILYTVKCTRASSIQLVVSMIILNTPIQLEIKTIQY